MSGMDLAEFLLARIAEDEEAARAASPGPWRPDAEHSEVLAVDDITVAEGFALSGPQLRATVNHIARHDPARVLAECEAKRRLVKWARDWPLRPARPSDEDATLGLLALPYADHSEYRTEWSP